MKVNGLQQRIHSILGGVGLLVALSVTGCQVDAGGQTLPTPFYRADDVQYFAPGSEFKLAKEAAAMQAQRADLNLQNAGQ